MILWITLSDRGISSFFAVDKLLITFVFLSTLTVYNRYVFFMHSGGPAEALPNEICTQSSLQFVLQYPDLFLKYVACLYFGRYLVVGVEYCGVVAASEVFADLGQR